MNDKLELTTPNGRKVVIRNYTTRGDDRVVADITNKGIKAGLDSEGKESVTVDVAAQLEAEDKYVELLVETIDGQKPTLEVFDALRSEDYEAIKDKVREITSPKGASKS